MTKAEVIEALKCGHTLLQDGWASAEDVQAVDELVAEGLATREFIQRDQYSAWRIRWKQPNAEPSQ